MDRIGDSLTGLMQSSPCRRFLRRGFALFMFNFFNFFNLLDLNARGKRHQKTNVSSSHGLQLGIQVRMVQSRTGGHIESQAR